MTYTEYYNQLMAYGGNNCYQAKGGKSLLLNINKGFYQFKTPIINCRSYNYVQSANLPADNICILQISDEYLLV